MITSAHGDTLHQAYLLHRAPYSNSSLLIECFTLSEGRFPAIAKGVQKAGRPKSAGLLQPFQPLILKWSGKGEVKSLTGYEAASKPHNLKGSALYCGFYLNELLLRLTRREDPHENLFVFYSQTLKKLEEEETVEQTLRQFEIRMLDELGYGLLLGSEYDSGEAVSPAARYNYQIEKGPVLSDSSDNQSVSGKTLLALQEDRKLDDREILEARFLLRRILKYYLGDKPLKSRELFL